MESYHQLQSPQLVDELVFAQVLNGISSRNYEKAVQKILQTFGASASQLRQLNERDLSDQEIIAIFMDGKSFAENQMILALGVTLQGEKIVLGMV